MRLSHTFSAELPNLLWFAIFCPSVRLEIQEILYSSLESKLVMKVALVIFITVLNDFFFFNFIIVKINFVAQVHEEI